MAGFDLLLLIIAVAAATEAADPQPTQATTANPGTVADQLPPCVAYGEPGPEVWYSASGPHSAGDAVGYASGAAGDAR